MQRPPYIDPKTGTHHDCSNATFEGYLTKQSTWIKDWRKRYFILKGSKLFFAKGPYQSPHGMIDLSTCLTVKSADIKTRRKNSIEVSTAENTFLMFADSEKEKDDWIGSIGRAIVQSSTTYTGEDGRDVDERGEGEEEEEEEEG
mmetsp:Transcript_5029/g.5158  ORF Transcript_5029/g.5158 Transcript_5029/m.5158 type:complete len:144 (+) Transcript_5029:91-522(+)